MMSQSKRTSLRPVALGILGLAAILWGLSAQAMPVTFSEVADGASDPTIDGWHFFSGDPGAFQDAYTMTDINDPANQVLAGGFDTGSGAPHLSGSTGWAFIGIEGSSTGGAGFITDITLDAAFDNALPSGSELTMAVYDGTTFLDSASFTTSASTTFNGLALNLDELTFDRIYLYNSNGGNSSTFYIDNFNVVLTPKGGGGGGGGSVPEPASLFLAGLGLPLLGWVRRTARRERI